MHRGRKVSVLCKGQKGAESGRRAVNEERSKWTHRQGMGRVGLHRPKRGV